MDLRKLIPWKIKITSLYWVQQEEILNKDLNLLFKYIDNDEYSFARGILRAIQRDWNDKLADAPQDFTMKYFGETTRAESMINFLEAPLD